MMLVKLDFLEVELHLFGVLGDGGGLWKETGITSRENFLSFSCSKSHSSPPRASRSSSESCFQLV